MTPEKSISMITPMVQAVNAGMKTNTRRILKIQPPTWANEPQPMVGPFCTFHGVHPKGKCGHPKCACINEETGGKSMWTVQCPYGKPGDVLKLKEAHRLERDGSGYFLTYKADGTHAPASLEHYVVETYHRRKFPERWCSGRFMPAWAVRTRLQIASIRVEKLQDITEEDAIAEGACRKIWITSPFSAGALNARGERGTYRDGFKDLWQSINGVGSWALNPFVWRIQFIKLP